MRARYQRIFDFETYVEQNTLYRSGTAIRSSSDDGGMCVGACIVWCSNVLNLPPNGLLSQTQPSQQRAAAVQQLYEWPRRRPGVDRPAREDRLLRTLRSVSLSVSVYPTPVPRQHWAKRRFIEILEKIIAGPQALRLLLLDLSDGSGHAVAMLKTGTRHYYLFDPTDGVGLLYWGSDWEMRLDFTAGLLDYIRSRVTLLTFH